MLTLLAVLIFALAGCGEPASAPRTQAPEPSAATRATCRAMYPKQPALAQACMRRGTTGEAMPDDTPPHQIRSDADKAVVIAQWCSGLAGIPPVGQQVMTPKQFRAMMACVDAGFAHEGIQLLER